MKPRASYLGRLILPAAALISFCGSAPTVFAANLWDGGGGNANWTTAGNWDDNNTATSGSGNDIHFAGTTGLNSINDYTGYTAWRNILFDSGAGSFNLSSSSGANWDLYGKIENNSTSAQRVTIDAIALKSATANEFDATSGDLTITAKDIYNNGNNLNFYGTRTLTINNGGGNGVSGTGKVIMNSTGTAILAGSNAYSGNTEINSGMMKVGHSSGLGSSAVYVGNGGTTGTAATLLLSGSGLSVTNNLNTNSGTNSNRIIGGDNTSGTNTFSGTLAMVSGGSATLTAAAGGTVAFTGVISGTGQGITKAGLGTVTLSGAAVNVYTGTTRINSGTLKLDFANLGTPTNLINSASALTLGGGTLQLMGKTGVATSQTFASTTFAPGSSVIGAAPASGATLPSLALGALTFNLGGTVRFEGAATIGAGNAAVGATATITTTTSGIGSLGVILGGANPFSGAPATVGLYDWASTRLADGTAGTSPYTIIGGSQVTGFYQAAFGGNFDLTTNSFNTPTGTPFANTVRFNTSTATTLVNRGILLVGGFLITPNMGANNAQVTQGASAGDWQINRVTTPTGNQEGVIWQTNTLGYFTLNQNIANGRDSGDNNYVVKAGDGTAVFAGTGDSGYVGQTYINGGNLVITKNSHLGSLTAAAAVNLNGGTLFGNANLNLNNAGANKRPVTLLGNGGGLAASAGNTMTVDGVISGAAGTGPLVIGIPASAANGNVAGLLPGSGSIAGGQTVDTANTTAVFGTGTVALTGANTYTGGTTIRSGTLNINGINALGGGVYGGLTLNGGTLKYATAFSGNGSGDLTSIGTAGLTIASGGGTIDTNGNSVTYAGSIGNGGTGSLVVTSSAANGSLTLQGANMYTGGTTLWGGILHVTNSSGSATGSGAVAVNGGTLSGSGLIGGSVSLTGGTIAPGAIGTTLTVGSLTFNSGILSFSLGASDASSRISAADLTFTSAPTLSFNLSGVTSGETFTLLSSANAITNSSFFTGLSPITIGRITLTPQQTGNLLQLASTGSAGNLQWNNTSPATGDGSTWDITANQNWLNTGTSAPDQYFEGDNVTFNDTNNAHYAVTLNSTVNPASVTVNNSAGDYTFSGSGAIAGSSSLVKNGSSTLTLSTANTYSGGTTINTGTIATGIANALPTSGVLTLQGTGTLDLAGNNQTIASLSDGGVSTGTLTSSSGTPTLTVNNASANTFSGTISGSLGLTGVGTSTLTLSAANTYTGLTTVSSGTLAATNNSSLGSSSSSTGGLLLNPAAGTARVNFTSVAPAIASLASSGAGASSVVLGNGATPATTTLTVGGGNANTTFAGVISDVNSTTALGNLALIGTGTLSLTGANSYHGATTISFGATLLVGNASALQNSSVDFTNGTLTFGTTTTAATFGSLQGTSGSQNLTLTNTAGSPAAVTLTTGGNAGATTYAGVLSGMGSLIKAGSGTMILSGANSYAGSTSANGGVLQLNTDGVINGTGIFTNAGQLVVNGGSLTASAASTVNTGGAGFLLDSGSATFNGGITSASSGSDGQVIRVDGGSFSATNLTVTRNQNIGSQPTVASTIGTSGFYVTDGTVSLGTLQIGTSNSSATTRIDGGDVTATGQVTIGNTSNGGRWNVLLVNGGTFTSTDASNGVVLSPSTTTANNSELMLAAGVTTAEKLTFGATGSSGTGVLLMNGGSLYLGSGGMVNPAGTATLTLNSGSIGAKADWSTSLNATLGSPAFTFKAADVSNVFHDITLSGVLSGGGLAKTGGGILTLSGTNTYSGTTSIKAGTLTLDAPGSIANSAKIIVGDTGSSGTVLDVSAKTGGFTIAANQTLSGIGTVDANDDGTLRTVTIEGTHAVGNSSGSQTVDGNLAYTNGSIFEWDLAANNDTDGADNLIGATGDNGVAGIDYDAVAVSGTLNIASDAVFKVIQNTGADFSNAFWTSNQSWSNIFNATGAITSGWTNVAVTVYDTSYALQDVSSYGSFSITGSTLTWSAVPEPTSALACLLIGAGFLRRRRA